jgi:sialic acid synthase SpsE
MLRDEDYRTLAVLSQERGIPLSASVFDRRGLDLLCELDPPYIKIASCDLNHSALLKEAASRGKRILLSTGMSTLAEIERAVRDVHSTGCRDLVLLHCVSVYPCPVEQANLEFLDTLKSAFGLPVGFSDHTESSVAAVIAVSKGARWIEKHLTLDRRQPGFDHAYAMEPGALAAFIRDVRAAAEACRVRDPKVGADEARVRQRARRALYAARDLAAGETLSLEDVLVVRPEGPLSPNDLEGLTRRTLRRDVRRYEPLSRDDFA